MGFSTALQGTGAHEAILARQDAELRLLETMRRCLVSKIRCDRDFSTALTGVAAQSNKKDWEHELADSLVVKKQAMLRKLRVEFTDFSPEDCEAVTL
ncbi:hypothetical protein B566_EDAN002461 [Ephemera danica]|nr:hypothetical protein B566_EDAN002461 [Ephemera danica]